MKPFIIYILFAVVNFIYPAMSYAQSTLATDSVDRAEEEVNILYGKQKYGRFVGNMSAVKGDDLTSYPSLTVEEALAGRLPGFFVMQNSASPGMSDFSNYIRGSVGNYITLVDGVERALTTYDMEQIEDIRVLKDPVSKALYGGRISNGILMVTTKRGKDAKSEFKINVQGGLKMPTVLPKYLNSYDFATHYNQALTNDGITVGHYDDKALEAYKNHLLPYQYPDVNFYDEFLNKSMNVIRLNAEYYGGNDRTQYFIHGGFQKEGGLETYGDKKTSFNSFNLQGNLDSKFSDHILLHANVMGYIANQQAPGDFTIETLSSRYPNSYPILVGRDSIGGTYSWKDNPYGGQALSGYTKNTTVRIQADLALEFKLDALVKGLSFKPSYSMDIYHSQILDKINLPAIYSAETFDLLGYPIAFNEIQTEQLATKQSMGSSFYTNNWAFNTMLTYAGKFGNHEVDADLMYYISKLVTAGELMEYKRQNLGVRVNYTFKEKYSIEGVLNYTGSQSYAPGNRFRYYPAIGAGWLLSKEEFMKNVSWIDFLKLNASWGIMGDGGIADNYWRETWARNEDYNFNSSSKVITNYLERVGNMDLGWPKQHETDISIEANMLKKIYWKVSYFDYLESGWLSRRQNTLPSIIGGETFLPWVNYGKTSMNGVELELAYTTKIQDVGIRVGGHTTISHNKKKLVDELPDPNYITQGTAWDAIWGYRANGVYTQEEINKIQAGTSDLPQPSYMDSKELKAGNIKYRDLNGDKVIDKYDMEVIGNNMPQIMYGFDLNLTYKGFNLYVMFLGYDKFDRLLNNSYYQIFSTRKYSNVLFDGLPNGNPHPQLTTGPATNDMQTSDYWITKGSYLKLKNASLSYSLPQKVIKPLFMKEAKFSLYGTNLLTFSKIKASDPESLNAGLTEYPLFRTVALGFTATF